MKRLAAFIRKDILLFSGGLPSLLLVLLLPVALLFSMYIGMGETTNGSAFMEHFTIAVRDEDDTAMSRSLISQLRALDAFNEVLTPNNDVSDDELIDSGVVAVITLPKDFFYSIYNMENTPAKLLLSSEKPLESSIFRSIFVSAMGSIQTEQQIALAEFRMINDREPNEAELEGIFAESSANIISDIMSSKEVFDIDEKTYDETEAARYSYLVCTLSLVFLLIPMGVLKTLPEELSMGITERLGTSGGAFMPLLLSKLISSFAISSIPTIAVLMILRPDRTAMAIPVLVLVFLASFSLMLLMSSAFGASGRSALFSSVIVLSLLTFGGALYPSRLLPEPFRAIGRSTLPYYLFAGLQGVKYNVAPKVLCRMLAPVFAMIPTFSIISAIVLKRRLGKK